MTPARRDHIEEVDDLILDLVGSIPRFVDMIDQPLVWPKVKDSDRIIQCEFCERRFATGNAKKRHIAAKHGGRA